MSCSDLSYLAFPYKCDSISSCIVTGWTSEFWSSFCISLTSGHTLDFCNDSDLEDSTKDNVDNRSSRMTCTGNALKQIPTEISSDKAQQKVNEISIEEK